MHPFGTGFCACILSISQIFSLLEYITYLKNQFVLMGVVLMRLIGPFINTTAGNGYFTLKFRMRDCCSLKRCSCFLLDFLRTFRILSVLIVPWFHLHLGIVRSPVFEDCLHRFLSPLIHMSDIRMRITEQFPVYPWIIIQSR